MNFPAKAVTTRKPRAVMPEPRSYDLDHIEAVDDRVVVSQATIFRLND
jgi:hypothetical protein